MEGKDQVGFPKLDRKGIRIEYVLRKAIKKGPSGNSYVGGKAVKGIL
jgi:hypothetical protein